MATRGVIVDRFGRPVEDDEDFDGVVPDGGAVRVRLPFMDAKQRAVAQWARDQGNDNDDDNPYQVSDEQRQRVEDAYVARSIRLSRGMHRHRVPTPVSDDVSDSDDADPRAAAYDAMKRRLSGAWKARRAPVPRDPDWLK